MTDRCHCLRQDEAAGAQILRENNRFNNTLVRIEAAAPPDELEQPSPGVMILPVGAEMLGQLVDPARQKGDLNLGRARVRIALAVPGDDFSLGFFGESHSP